MQVDVSSKYKPIKIFLAISNNCNLSCPYCFSHAGVYCKDLQFETVKTIIDQIIDERKMCIRDRSTWAHQFCTLKTE